MTSPSVRVAQGRREARPRWQAALAAPPQALRAAGLSLLMGALAVPTVDAAPPPIAMPVSGDEEASAGASGPLGFLQGLNRSSALLGDLWGLRTALSRLGISLAIQETSEVLGNTSGGTQRGFAYDGLTQALVQLDTQRSFGHYGGLANVSLLNLHGSNLSADNLQTLQTASGIEGDRGTRLWEAWYDQKFLDEDRLDIKIGQQSLDQEFMVSANALYFVNTMFGWPMLPSADLPGGGPAYPLSVLGLRLAARPVNGLNLLAGVYNGSPVNGSAGSDPQRMNPHGTSFPLGGGTLAIVELQSSYPALGSMVEPGEAQALGRTYRIGAWYDSQAFADQRVDTNGLSLANPQANGIARSHKGNQGFYAVADQLVWRDERDPNRTASVFTRLMYTPFADRNLIDWSLNAGVLLHSPLPYRFADTFGVGMGVAHVSPQAAGLDQDSNLYNAPARPVRSSETFFEITYQYQLRPWIQLQPDIQYVLNPGAGIANPAQPGSPIRNELVLGLRTNISF